MVSNNKLAHFINVCSQTSILRIYQYVLNNSSDKQKEKTLW